MNKLDSFNNSKIKCSICNKYTDPVYPSRYKCCVNCIDEYLNIWVRRPAAKGERNFLKIK